MKKLIICLTLLAFVLVPTFLMPQKAEAGQVTLNPRILADTWISSPEPVGGHGTEQDMNFMYWDDTATSNWMLLEFDIESLPSNATIDSAYLKLYGVMCVGSPNPTTFTLAQITSHWNEPDVAWSSRPSIAGGVQTTANSSCPSGYTSYSVTSIVNEWKNGDRNLGIAIYGPKNNKYYRTYKTREAGQAYEPLLTIRYTVPDAPAPVPEDEDISGGTAGTGITTTQTPTTPTSSTTAPVDATVDAPTFEKVLSGADTLPVDGGIVEISYDKLIMVMGKGSPGHKILMFVDGKTYETTVNSLGYWGITLEVETFKEGNYLVTAQAINSAGKGSQVANMVTLNKIDLNELVRNLSAGAGLDWVDRFGIIMIYGAPIIGLLFWITLIALIIFLVKRHKKKKAEETKEMPIEAMQDSTTEPPIKKKSKLKK